MCWLQTKWPSLKSDPKEPSRFKDVIQSGTDSTHRGERELLSFWAAKSQPSSKKAYKSEQLPEGEVGLHQPPHSTVQQWRPVTAEQLILKELQQNNSREGDWCSFKDEWNTQRPVVTRRSSELHYRCLICRLQKLQANVAHGNSQDQETQVIAVNGVLRGRARRDRGPHAKIHTHCFPAFNKMSTSKENLQHCNIIRTVMLFKC